MKRTEIDRDWLVEMYVNQMLSLAEVAALINVTPMTIHKRLRQYGIPTRQIGSHMKDERNWRKGKAHSDSTKQKLSLANRGRKRSPESIQKQREKISGNKSSLFGKPTKDRPPWIVTWREKTISMRSRWEVQFADWLCSQGKDWTFEPETFILPDGSAYTPDFESEGVYYEIKGRLKLSDEKKIEAFKASHPLKLMMLDDLRALGLEVVENAPAPKFIRIVQGFIKTCAICSTEFFPAKRKVKCCGSACAAKLNGKNRTKEKTEEITCMICGAKARFPLCRKAKTCSKKCGRLLAARTKRG